MRRVWTWVGVVAMAATAFGQGGGDRLTPETFRKLEFRTIGPSLTTGRISDIAVDPKNPTSGTSRSSAGNLWKTENRGNTWTPIFETYGSYSLGAVVVDPKNSNVVWLGTGENNNQRSVSYGDGIYKSTDAGTTWKRMGLENSEHIQNILIDPRDSNVVYVTAIGPLWGAGRRPRPLQDDRWRQDVEGRADRQRRHRRDRHGHGPLEARRALCRRAISGGGPSDSSSAADPRAASTRRPTAARSGPSSPRACRPWTSGASGWRSTGRTPRRSMRS